MPGTGELLFIMLLVVVLFGPDKLPELARTAGKALREVRKVTAEFHSQLNLLAEEPDKRTTPNTKSSANESQSGSRASVDKSHASASSKSGGAAPNPEPAQHVSKGGFASEDDPRDL